MRATTCGVLVTDPAGNLLLGQATGSVRWDIPKGLAEPGESHADAARRELREETGLVAADLHPLGAFRYLPAKDLALFAFQPDHPIDPATLRCASTFTTKDGRTLPELSRFALLPWPEALTKVGKNLRRILQEKTLSRWRERAG